MSGSGLAAMGSPTPAAENNSTQGNKNQATDSVSDDQLNAAADAEPSVAASSTSRNDRASQTPQDSTKSAAGDKNLKPSQTESVAVTPSPIPPSTNSSSTLASDSNGSGGPTSTPNIGALAGGIVGAFLAGLIIALFAAYMFGVRRKKHSSKRRSQHSSFPADYAEHKKASDILPAPAAWERYLPQPVDDKAMRAAVSSVLDQVALHVTNVYSKKTILLSNSLQDSMAKIDSGLLPDPLSKLMMDPDLQAAAIKHCIAHILTTKMMPSDDADDTLLPPHLAAVPRGPVAGSAEGKEIQAIMQAHSTWRILTSYLFPEPRQNHSYISQKRRVTMDIVNDVSAAFGSWELSSSEGLSATEGLAQLADAASEVGTMISSQASAYRFEWRYPSNREKKDGSIHYVLLPAFIKIADERGRLLDKPHILIQPKTQQVGQGKGKRSHE